MRVGKCACMYGSMNACPSVCIILCIYEGGAARYNMMQCDVINAV